MKILEAYKFTLEKLEELKNDGIEIEMIIPRSVREKGEGYEDLINKYSGPDRLPVDLWRHVTLKYRDQEQASQIFEAAKYLGMAGISFDKGGFQNSRDWELDWSFTSSDKWNDKALESTKIIEDLINTLTNKQ